MKPKDKELLLQDLCARLQYGVKGECEIDASYDTSFDTVFQLHTFDAILNGIKEDLLFVTPLIEDKDEQEFANEEVADGIDILDFKPYLRPMSSQTSEEREELNNILQYQYYSDDSCMCEATDWLNAHHFDYRGLIDKGLAIEVTEENKPYKN